MFLKFNSSFIILIYLLYVHLKNKSINYDRFHTTYHLQVNAVNNSIKRAFFVYNIDEIY